MSKNKEKVCEETLQKILNVISKNYSNEIEFVTMTGDIECSAILNIGGSEYRLILRPEEE